MRLVNRFNVWVASQTIKNQRRIALTMLFVGGIIVLTPVVAVSLFIFNLIVPSEAAIDIYWALVFAAMAAGIAVWEERNDAVPEGGFKASKD